jgi:protein-S-isoprenylcysteine O-methyltransferase Ste14
MIEDRRPLPESSGALVQTAFRAYRRRFALYFGTAAGGLIAEAVATCLAPENTGVIDAGSIVVDSLIAAVVTLGVVADVREGDPLPDRAVAGRAVERWGLVAVVATLVQLITLSTSDAVFGTPESTGYGLLILPIVLVWGSLSFATVIATIDEKTPARVLAFSSIGRSFSLAIARQNWRRLAMLAIVAVLPVLVENVLMHQLELRKVAGSTFIANIPIDALVSGPLQAVFTIFYLDFVRRSSGSRTK